MEVKSDGAVPKKHITIWPTSYKHTVCTHKGIAAVFTHNDFVSIYIIYRY